VPDGKPYETVFEHRHAVVLARDSLLGKAIVERSVQVTSAHRQGIDRLGGGLKIEALSDDGFVEAVSATGAGAPVLAVQWHPEIATRDCLASTRFYGLLRDTLRGVVAFA
jgi:putative glutamine amidotransferase